MPADRMLHLAQPWALGHMHIEKVTGSLPGPLVQIRVSLTLVPQTCLQDKKAWSVEAFIAA